MRTSAIRATALVVVAALVLAAAVLTLGGQPKVLTTHSGAVPDVQCSFGVSPAQSFCYATPPVASPLASKAPDTNVAPPSAVASTAP